MPAPAPPSQVQHVIKQKTNFDPAKYATGKLKIEDVVKLKECFDVFDADHGGTVSPDELVNTIKALELEDKAQQVLNIVSSVTEGDMDFATFVKIFGFVDDSLDERTLQQLFEVFDRQGRGSFAGPEFDFVAKSVGENFSGADIDEMIDYADKDRDGVINYEEFLQVVTKQYPKV